MRNDAGATEVQVEGPAFTRFLFSNTQAGLFWLPIRLFVGFSWLEAGWGKLSGSGWLDGGTALQGFWTRGRRDPGEGSSADRVRVVPRLHQPPAPEQRLHLVRLARSSSASSLVGLGLLFGALTGFAAFFGALMNMSFLLAGSASSNPVLFTMAIGLILGWKVAGYFGLDRYLLPLVGVPWRARRCKPAAPVSTAADGLIGLELPPYRPPRREEREDGGADLVHRPPDRGDATPTGVSVGGSSKVVGSGAWP